MQFDDIDIEEALSRRPLPWTYQGQVDSNRRREATRLPRAQSSPKEELEDAKLQILAMKTDLENTK
jgi:hypothetical protein